MLISDPLFYLAAVPAILITGVSKGGFGAGLGILAVPLMALTLPPGQAVGIMLPILCLMDLFGLWAYRASWHGGILRVAIPGALGGIVLGALTFHLLQEAHIKLLIGAIALVFTLNHWISARGEGIAARVPRAGALGTGWGVLWSAVSGFTSFAAHAGGPPLSVYLLPMRMHKTLFVGTTVVFFAAVNYAKLLPYAWLGQLGAVNLGTALVLSPLAPLGIRLGVWLHARIDPANFYRVCYVLVFLAGAKLMLDGVGLTGTGF